MTTQQKIQQYIDEGRLIPMTNEFRDEPGVQAHNFKILAQQAKKRLEKTCKDLNLPSGHVPAIEPEKPKARRTDLNEPTRKWLKTKGYYPYRADYFDHRTKRQQDFMGLFDYLAFGHGETLAIQITSKPNISTRVKKIQEHPARVDLLKSCGWKILVLGFYKNNSNHWEAIEKWL